MSFKWSVIIVYELFYYSYYLLVPFSFFSQFGVLFSSVYENTRRRQHASPDLLFKLLMFWCLLLKGVRWMCFFTFLFFACRWTRRTARATAASQDSKSCCTNSWRESRCRRRWPSSYGKGIGLLLSAGVWLLSFFLRLLWNPCKQCLWRNISSYFRSDQHTWLYCSTPKKKKRRWKARLHKDSVVTKLFASPLRIKIEEEYAKSLSRLSQIPLASQEEGWVTIVLKRFQRNTQTPLSSWFVTHITAESSNSQRPDVKSASFQHVTLGMRWYDAVKYSLLSSKKFVFFLMNEAFVC